MRPLQPRHHLPHLRPEGLVVLEHEHRPLRGEGGAESRRRILGMGGMIEPIRSEERTQFHFGAKM